MSTPLEQWVESVARMTRPATNCVVRWVGRRSGPHRRSKWFARATQFALNEKTYPNCFLHRSDPSDVARTEKVTFICTRDRENAGPTNNWMAPAEAKQTLGGLFDGSMKGRTMYVVPYILGPAASPQSRIGVEVTDSAYVVASMRIMSRMGKVALDRLGSSSDFVPGLHSLGDLNPDRRYIAHFPEEKLIWSIGSGYGGNALLGKKCFALRIASWMAREQGWMAEHMLILGLESPSGKVTYMAAAFPSACGKTNLAMMVSALENEGYRVWTVGDDIAWMQVGRGRLPARHQSRSRIFRRGARHERKNQSECDDRAAQEYDLHEYRHDPAERALVGGHGRAILPRTWWIGRDARGRRRMVRRRSRIRAIRCRRVQAPSISPRWEDPAGVPISAFIFGGRRARLAPLVYEATNWQHGVYVAATMASETTAADHRRRGRHAARPDGHASLLRIQHGAIISGTGWKWAAAFPIRRKFST